MSVALQYQARRDQPLSGLELAEVKRIIAEAGDPRVEDEGDPWEPFSVFQFERSGYVPMASDEILAGATKVFDEAQVAHWLELLSRLRKLLPAADWGVSLDGEHLFRWDDETQSYLMPDL